MAEPGSLNLEAFKHMVRGMINKLITKQAENFKEELKQK